jgi:hypothetical protein
MIMIINVWNLFGIIFWVSVTVQPDEVFQSISIFCELVFLTDTIIRFALSVFNPGSLKFLQGFHWKDKESALSMILIIIGSVPQVLLWEIWGVNDLPSWCVYLLLLKFTRLFEAVRFRDFLNKYLLINEYEAYVTASLTQNLFYMLLFVHFVTCSWLFTIKMCKTVASLII